MQTSIRPIACAVSRWGTAHHIKLPPYLTRGAHASFVNREVAQWIEEHGGADRQVPQQQRGWQKAGSTSVSLAGTSMSSPILGSVVFNLTFFNEVSRRHETIKDIHAQIIDGCIAVIISRPLIRANHLVQKIPLYFDETPRSKPDLSQL